MYGCQIGLLVFGIIISFSEVLGQCPFAGKLHPAEIDAAVLDMADIKSPICGDSDTPYKLYTGDFMLRTKRSPPESNLTRVKRAELIPEYDMKATVHQCLHEEEEKIKSLDHLYEEGGPAYSPPGTPSFGHYVNFRARDASLDLSGLNHGLVKATQKMLKEYNRRYGMTPHTFMEFLRNHGYSVGGIPGACRPPPRCSRKSLYYRTFDGSCNNLYHTSWGMSKTPLVRIVPPSYKDAIYEPTVSVTGKEQPLASLVSLFLFPDAHIPDKVWTRAVMLWGQAMAHDMSLAPSTQSSKGPIKCCKPDNSGPLPKSQLHPACYPIIVPPYHPFYSKFGVRCLNFVRSMTMPSDGCKLGSGEQANIVSSFLDLSMVYGSSKKDADELRTFKNGLLITSFSKEAGGEILPSADDKKGSCHINSESEPCYKAGDVRVNLHLDLTILQTIFLRWHNEICRGLHKINPHWDDEKLYQEARKIAIGGYQHICYNEWLPILLGRKKMIKFGLFRPDEDYHGYVQDYDPEMPPGVLNAFTTSAFRVLHSTAPGILEMITPNREILDVKRLSDNYNKPEPLQQKHVFETLLIGLVTQSMQKSDEHYTRELTRYLFKFDNPFGFDLESFDIQRHRDHGLGSYNHYRYICGLPKAEKWEDFLDVMSPKSVSKLQDLYAAIDDVELLAGCTLEKHMKGSLVGPTAHCIITEQFYRTRRGDRFFYMNGEKPGGFTPAQLAEIKKYSWSRLICDTSHTEEIQPEGFRILSEKNPLVSCQSIPYINLEAWREMPYK